MFDKYKQYSPSPYIICIPCAKTTHGGVCMHHEGSGLWPMKAFERTTCHWCGEVQEKNTLIIPFSGEPEKHEGEGR